MTDTATQTTQETKTPSELELLKAQADSYGIEYKNNVTVKTLKKLISEHFNNETQDDANQALMELENEAKKLVRVIVTPIDPLKAHLEGDYFSVGNSFIGTISHYVPFNKEWLLPNMLVKNIQEREYQHIQTKEAKTGIATMIPKFVKAYNVQILPLPTPEEIAELAKQQLIAQQTQV